MFEKKSIRCERLSIRHETQCNMKFGVFHCLTNINIYKAAWADIARAKFSVACPEFILIDITELTWFF